MNLSVHIFKNNSKKYTKTSKVSAGSTFDLEKELVSRGYKLIIGIDEAGRGPLAGPVVACAVALKNYKKDIEDRKNLELVRDSKTLSKKQRENIFDFIHENFHVGIGLCDHNTIDRMNILEASFLAMKSAISSLNSKLKNQNYLNKKCIILLDGNKPIPNISMEQKVIVNGDKIVKSISAASIVAKVMRDKMMLEFHEKYPVYFFDRHKGYGTRLHMESLQKYGPCEIHRRSFRPVKILIDG